jgi:hypothetical protein
MAAVVSGNSYLDTARFVLGKTPDENGDRRHWVSRVARETLMFARGGRGDVSGMFRMISLLAFFAAPVRSGLGITMRQPHWTNTVARANLPLQNNFIFKLVSSFGFLTSFSNPTQTTSTWNSTSRLLNVATPKEIRLSQLADCAMTGRALLTLALFGINPVHRRVVWGAALGAHVCGLAYNIATLQNIELPRFWEGKIINPYADPTKDITPSVARVASREDKIHNWMKVAWHVTGIVLSLLSIMMMAGIFNSFIMTRYLFNGLGLLLAVVPEIYDRAIIQPNLNRT